MKEDQALQGPVHRRWASTGVDFSSVASAGFRSGLRGREPAVQLPLGSERGAIILPHSVLFRGGAEAKIRPKLLEDGHIDIVIGLPANLFYSIGIPVCILVLKKCKKPENGACRPIRTSLS